ncbi:class I adenylate-forming enzyme family protein [Mycobacterium conspicuum]|jgi:acyl-CoA synthetase (AMP-forming)/AMP-acid ligase II|uniref:AMP-binding protein n=1 Tax=Mycobacterium conspicuum TaxID=44010 RepID=A0A1X1TBE8_9MYCO|nr:class I adenylate-forming enzyme family protein [Mycobacterium conspicuum]ORV41828.1 AMP-binding protein [Mycobacterium conspicuum]BBZ40744.1 AMP-binding protein [Mycobacterium conspicuum]
MPADSPTVAEILRHQAGARSDHPLLICDHDRTSYAEAEQRSAELARGLITLGTGKGTHVGLLYPNGTDFVVGMLAAARIGAVVVPFSTFATARELREQLVDADVEILLSASSFRSHDYRARLVEVLAVLDLDSSDRLFVPAVPQLRHVVINRERVDQLADAALLEALEDDVDGSDPLAIIYTSGSTSTPKGVVHTHAALLGHQRNLNEIRGLAADDRLFCNSPFFWVGGFAFGLLATLVAGSTLICSNATDAGQTLDLLEAEKPTMTNGFAAGIAHLAADPSFAGRDLSSLQRGNLYPIMAPSARPADPELRHNMLGLTEAGSIALISGDESDQPEKRRGSFGKPAPGFQTKILNPDADGVGELCIRGPFVMQGYHKRSREDCFDADGWFHTGDLVRTDDDGFVYFVGRLSAMIKTAGANVSAAEVEKAIARVAGVQAHVVGLPDAERGELVAAVLVEPGIDEAALRDRLKKELSSYKIPKRFRSLSRAELPLLSSGKVDTRRLKKLFDA